MTAVRNAFNNQIGRVVPLYTQYWGGRLNGHISLPPGNNADPINGGSRWSNAKQAAAKVARGDAYGAGTGLVGEAGIAGTGEWYDNAAETNQIKADLDQGKIPFYNYAYTSGHVLHNNVHIWNGQTLTDAMNVLLAKFPAPPPIVSIPIDGGGDVG